MTMAVGGVGNRRPGSLPASYEDNSALLRALAAGEAAARTALIRQHTAHVEKIVASVLGVDADFSDVVQDIFLAVLTGVHRLRDPEALRSWITAVAVAISRRTIRKRRRWRWIRFVAPEELPEVAAHGAPTEAVEALKATYRALARLPEQERVAFSLRFLAEMELTEVAAACDVSLATIKRRLSRSETLFLELAAQYPALAERLARTPRETAP